MAKLSVVTPSFRQGAFIGRTIESVLSQGIPDLEYLVMDGGSRDGTLEILRSFEPRLRWVSERDKGQADAVNKAILATDGEIIGWINSDDVYLPGTLQKVLRFFERNPEVDVVYGDAYHIDEDDRILERYPTEPWIPENLWDSCYLCQPATFFRRRVVERCGLLDTRVQFCMDYEYWLRLLQGGMRFAYLRSYLAGSRLHRASKTLGRPVAAQVDANHMLKRKLGSVPDRWLKNWSHVFVRTRFRFPEPGARFVHMLAALTWIAAYRWNRSISRELREEIAGWIDMTREILREPRPRKVSLPPVLEQGRPLRLGIDISATGDRAAARGRFTENMVRCLSDFDFDNHYLLYSSFGDELRKLDSADAGLVLDATNFRSEELANSAELARNIWREPGPDPESLLGHPDLVHATHFFCPRNLESARLVYTLYDLDFVLEPDAFDERDRQIAFEGVFRASQYADLILATSDATRRGYLRLFPRYPEDRVLVVRPFSRFDEMAEAKRPVALPELLPFAFLLYVGTRGPQGNLARLVDAYAANAKRGVDTPPLVLAGGGTQVDGTLAERARRLGIADRLLDLGQVDDRSLHWLYRHCAIFLYPASSDGIGLPVVEAMSQGRAVLTSTAGALPEVAGDAAILVDPSDREAISREMERLLRDGDLRRDLEDRARPQARRFTREGFARSVQSAHRQALEREKYRASPFFSDHV